MVEIKDFGPIHSIWFAHSTDEKVRFLASSGGFIKSFLVYLLERGVVDFAIITRTGGSDNPLKPETIITDSRQDILSARSNSVYMVHNPAPIFKEIAENKRYAFVGLPCHIEMLRRWQKRGKYRNIVVAVGLFCHYAPKPEFTGGVLERLGVDVADVRQIEYRGHGWPGGFTAHLWDGQERFIPSSDYWDDSMANAPPMCRSCSAIASGADIWVGDPWNLGLEKSDTEGTSLVVCRNRRASFLVWNASWLGYVRIDECSGNQLVRAQGDHVERKMRNSRRGRIVLRLRHLRYLGKRACYLSLHPKEAYPVAMDITRFGIVWARLKEPIMDFRTAREMLEEPDQYDITHVACRLPLVRSLLRLLFANRVLLWTWREERKYLNFGEYIPKVILKKFGYRIVDYCNARDLGILPRYKFCMLMVTSELHKAKMDELDVPQVYVWGAGKGRGDFFDIRSSPYAEKVKIFAVRGPHTIGQLNLDRDTPVGDPGFVMPLLYSVSRDPSQHRVIYVPHWDNRGDWERKCAEVGAEGWVDVRCLKKEWWGRLRSLVSAKFVLTNTFHAAVVCHAYGTPWALCLAAGDSLDCPDKWQDLFAYLGISGIRIVGNYGEGLRWWEEVGCRARKPPLEPLLWSFPLKMPMKMDGERVRVPVKQIRLDSTLIAAFERMGSGDALLQFMLSHVLPGSVVYDVGACGGLYSILLADRISNSLVYAFEPNPASFNQLVANIGRAGLQGRVVPLNVALDECCGTRLLNISSDPARSSFYEYNATYRGNTIVKSVRVKCCSVDHLVESGLCRPPDAIKIDTEGNEHRVLFGGRSVIASRSPDIFFEPHGMEGEAANTTEPVREFLSRFGYGFESLGYPVWCHKQGGPKSLP